MELALLRCFAWLMVLLGMTAAPDPRPLVAQAIPDSAVARSVYWGKPLQNLLDSVSNLLGEGFGDREVEQLSRDALSRSPFPIPDRDTQRVSLVRRVRFRDRQTELTVRLTPVELGYLDVRFQASDEALIAAIRDVIWKSHLASLLPLEAVRLTVGEQVGGVRSRPTLVLAVETQLKYSCLGFAIDHLFRQRADTLDLEFFGVAPPTGLCPQALGPATMARELHLPPGRYVLRVKYRASSGQITLDVTDSSTQLSTNQVGFVDADERLRWRFPPRSFALFCENVEVARPVCDDVSRWVAHQPGISPLSFSSQGLNPYRPGPPRVDQDGSFYRYQSDEALEHVRRCFADIADQLREVVGVALTIRTWTGDQITAWSGRSLDQPHIAVPRRVTTGSRCTGGSSGGAGT